MFCYLWKHRLNHLINKEHPFDVVWCWNIMFLSFKYRKYLNSSSNILKQRTPDPNQFVSRQSRCSWFNFTFFIPIQKVSWRITLSPLSGDYCFSLEVDNRFQQSCCKQLCTFNGWSFVKMRFNSNLRYVIGPIEDHMPFQVRKPLQQYHYKNHHETTHTTKIPPQKAIRDHHKPPETCKTLRNVPICES